VNAASLRWVLAAGLCAGLWPTQASAFCRLTTEQPAASMCPEPCLETGTPVAWRRLEVSYALNDALVPDLDEATARRIIADSFAAWTDVECEDGPVALHIDQEPGTTSIHEPSHKDDEQVIVYRTRDEWKALHPFRDRAFALTQVWFRTDSGEVVGADMELNGGLGAFTECPQPDGCAPGGLIDLGNVVTHEAGHFLGLAHSDVEDATMSCDAQPWAINKRTLHEDDIAGVCSIYGSAASALLQAEAGAGKSSGGCSAGPSAFSASGFWLLAALPWLRRRSRR